MSQKNLETYYDFAENSYEYLKFAVDNNIIANDMAAQAQNICERYLKHIIEEYYIADTSEKNDSKVKTLHSHSLMKILNFIKNDMNIDIDNDVEKSILYTDVFYFTSRYPGDDSLTITKDNIENCFSGVNQCRDFANKVICEMKSLADEESSNIRRKTR